MLTAHERCLWTVDNEGNIVDEICQEVCVSKKRRDLLTGATTAYLTVCHSSGDEEYEMPRRDLNRSKLQGFLLDKDVSIADDEDTIADVVDYVLDTDKLAPVSYYHEKLGYANVNDELIYLSAKPIGDLRGAKADSKYINMDELGMQGTFESWRQVIEEEVLGNPYLELALAIGASAPLVYLMRKDGLYSELPVIALVGQTSTGKTTSIRLIASIEGSPLEGAGLVKDLNATTNAFFKQMAEKQGNCFLFDEATGKGDWRIADVLYSLVKGIEKARCSASGKLNDRAMFSGTVVLSGEQSLISDSKLNGGALGRIIEASFPWTRSGEHADRLCRKLNENHGHAIRPLVEYILASYRKSPKIFAQMFDEELSLLKQIQPTTHNVEGRVYKIYATLLVAAKIAGDAWQLPFQIHDIRKILLENHLQKKPMESQAKRLYDLVMSKINQNSACFPEKAIMKEMKRTSSGRILGKREKKDGKNVVWITCDAFKNYVQDQFSNPAEFFPELVDKKLMLRDSQRHYSIPRALLIGTCPCYGFYITSSLYGDDIDKRTPKLQKKIGSQIDNLLADEDDEPVMKNNGILSKNETIKEHEEVLNAS